MNKNDLIPSSKILRNILIIMWSALVVYLIIKLLGGNWFEIICTNQRFINICQYIDTHFFIRYIVSLITTFIVCTLLYLSMLQQWVFMKNQLIVFLIWIPIQTFVKNIFMDNTIISFSLSFVTGIIVPCILYVMREHKLKFKFVLLHVLLTNVFDIAFQLISLLIKNIGVKIIDDSTLVTLIFMIDVFIMETLYYLYTNKIHQERRI